MNKMGNDTIDLTDIVERETARINSEKNNKLNELHEKIYDLEKSRREDIENVNIICKLIKDHYEPLAELFKSEYEQSEEPNKKPLKEYIYTQIVASFQDEISQRIAVSLFRNKLEKFAGFELPEVKGLVDKYIALGLIKSENEVYSLTEEGEKLLEMSES